MKLFIRFLSEPDLIWHFTLYLKKKEISVLFYLSLTMQHFCNQIDCCQLTARSKYNLFCFNINEYGAINSLGIRKSYISHISCFSFYIFFFLRSFS